MKIYVTANAEKRSEISKYLKSQTRQVIIHLLKIFLFPHNQSMHHWCTEVTSFLTDIDVLKGKHKFPDKNFILRNTWEYKEDCIKPYAETLIRQRFYGEPECLVEEVYDKIFQYFNWLAERLSTDGFVDSTAVYKKLNELCK